MEIAWGIGVGLGIVVIVLVSGFTYLGVVLAWEDQRTRGMGYYGLSPEERLRFRSRLRWHARALHPILLLTRTLARPSLAKGGFQYRGFAGPKGTCSIESFEHGAAYVPRPEDVFVVTQMKSGTTWMQHLVYQVLTRGEGDLPERGRTLYAVSPWLEGLRSVSTADAPLVGRERPSRILKTHFPVELCPIDAAARYVYVVRHPVSCFASCADFLRANLGPFAPDAREMRDWFCSDETMWWGSWPRHVDGWWKAAQQRENVLFVRFGDMNRDLAGVAARVAIHLGMEPLSASETEAVTRKCGFTYMRAHAGSFEMHPPHLLATDAELFVKGTVDRYRDLPDGIRQEIMQWCRERIEPGGFPLDQAYPSSGEPSPTRTS